jgi:hypothetical protein
MSGTAIPWPKALMRYTIASLVLHAAWEVAQLPLYTIWSIGTVGQRWFAVAHCTLGDVMIAGLTLLVALASLGSAAWPSESSRAVWLLSVVLGSGYTIYSEWLNVTVRGSWAYAESMPTLPVIGTGLSPLVQWLVVPTLALWIAARRRPWLSRRGTTHAASDLM